MKPYQERTFVAIAAKLDAGETFNSHAEMAASLGVTRGILSMSLSPARAAGLIEGGGKGVMHTVALTPKGRQLLKKLGAAPASTPRRPPPRTSAPIAPSAPAPAPLAPATHPPAPTVAAVGSTEPPFTAADMRLLLDMPRAAVRIVRRALGTSWGPGLLDALDTMVEETEAVPQLEPAPVRRHVPAAMAATARAPKAPSSSSPAKRPARAAAPPPAPAAEEDEEQDDDAAPRVARDTKPGRERYLLIGTDDQTLDAFDTLDEAKDAMADDDDADHVYDVKLKKPVARKGVDDEDDDDLDEDAAE